MTSKLIQIGNSRGIRLSKSLIDQYAFDEEVELIPEKAGILIMPKKHKAREGWEEILKASEVAHTKEDAEWLDSPLSADNDWTW